MILGISLFVFNNKNADVDIEEVLKTSAYSYLSSNAKDYIKNYYNQTGEVLLTEKNKVEGKAYLNPDYIEYLDELGVGNTGYIPNELTSDYNNELGSSNINDLPRKYDSRNVNGNSYITPLKNQGGFFIFPCYTDTGKPNSRGAEHDRKYRYAFRIARAGV